MLPSAILDQIRALNLDPFTETRVCEIVQEAIDGSRAEKTTGVAIALQIPGDWPADYQKQFWDKYPNKKSKKIAMKALEKIAFAGKTRWVDLINGIGRYILSKEVQRGFVKHPATWLNGECWQDQEQTTPFAVGRPKSFFDVAAESFERSNGAGTDQGRW